MTYFVELAQSEEHSLSESLTRPFTPVVQIVQRPLRSLQIRSPTAGIRDEYELSIMLFVNYYFKEVVSFNNESFL